MVFERYLFEDPKDEARRVNVGTMGYVAAGLVGSLYVLWKAGMVAFASALLPHLLLSGILVAATGVTSFVLPETQQLIVLLIVIPGILTVQALLMVEIIRKSYRRLGWIIDTYV